MSGGIPWDLPRDKAHFRAYAAHKPVLLGRKTFEEMRGWFTTQDPIFVLTSSTDYTPHDPHASVVNSIETAIALTKRENHPELVVLGGASVFEAALPHATQLVLTWVEADENELSPKTDLSDPVRFPQFTPADWQTTHSDSWPADSANPIPMSLEVLTRKSR